MSVLRQDLGWLAERETDFILLKPNAKALLLVRLRYRYGEPIFVYPVYWKLRYRGSGTMSV